MRKNLDSVDKYVAGLTVSQIVKKYNISETDIIKLNSNENPLGSSQKAVEAVKNYLAEFNKFSFYPEALGDSLVEKLRENFPEIKQDAEIITGNGLDNILEGFARLCVEPNSQVIIPSLTFSYYELISRWNEANIKFIENNTENNYSLNIEKLISIISDKTKVLFLCNPNNPTGEIIHEKNLELILDKCLKTGTFVFLDEAYIEYADNKNNKNIKSFIGYVSKYPNLVVGRTFSKIYGLAGLRIGWGVIHKNLIESYRKVQTPFSLNILGLISAKESLSDREFLNKSFELNKTQREILIKNLRDLGFRTLESQANFVSFEAGEKFSNNSKILCEYLMQHGIVLRSSSLKLVRQTVGTEEQNKKILEILKNL